MTNSFINHVAATGTECTAELWNQKLNHMSQKGMKELVSRGKLPKLKYVEFDMGESYVLGE